MEPEGVPSPVLAAMPHALQPDNGDSAGSGMNETEDVRAGIARTGSAPTPSPRYDIARSNEALSVEMVSSHAAPDTPLEPRARSRLDPPRFEATSEIAILRGLGGGSPRSGFRPTDQTFSCKPHPRPSGRAARRLPRCTRS